MRGSRPPRPDDFWYHPVAVGPRPPQLRLLMPFMAKVANDNVDKRMLAVLACRTRTVCVSTGWSNRIRLLQNQTASKSLNNSYLPLSPQARSRCPESDNIASINRNIQYLNFRCKIQLGHPVTQCFIKVSTHGVGEGGGTGELALSGPFTLI